MANLNNLLTRAEQSFGTGVLCISKNELVGGLYYLQQAGQAFVSALNASKQNSECDQIRLRLNECNLKQIEIYIALGRYFEAKKLHDEVAEVIERRGLFPLRERLTILNSQIQAGIERARAAGMAPYTVPITAVESVAPLQKNIVDEAKAIAAHAERAIVASYGAALNAKLLNKPCQEILKLYRLTIAKLIDFPGDSNYKWRFLGNIYSEVTQIYIENNLVKEAMQMVEMGLFANGKIHYERDEEDEKALFNLHQQKKTIESRLIQPVALLQQVKAFVTQPAGQPQVAVNQTAKPHDPRHVSLQVAPVFRHQG